MAGTATAAAVTHILVIPYPAQGHMPALLDLTHQLALRGLKITVLITPKNLPALTPLLSAHSTSIETLVLPLPPHPKVPLGVENLKDIGNSGNAPITAALSKLEEEVIQWFRSHTSPPQAIISDFFLGCTQHWATQLNIPRIAFYSVSALLTCILTHLWEHSDKQNISSIFEFPDLPSSPSFTLDQLPSIFRKFKEGDPDWEIVKEGLRANPKSWGYVFNSFYALEGDYLDHLKKDLGHGRVYTVGPLSLKGLSKRVNPGLDTRYDVLNWLDTCPDSSVLYVCFGSQKLLTEPQIRALALGLEQSKTRFIWVVKSDSSQQVPDGFEERVSAEFSFVEKGVEYLEEKTTLVEDGAKVVNNQDVVEDGAKVVDNQDVVEDGAKVVDNQDVEDGAKVVDNQDVEDGAKIVDNQDVMSSDLSVVYNDAGVSCQMEADFKRDENVTNDSNSAKKSMCTKESLLEDLESVLSNVADLEKEGLDTPEAKSESSDQENQNEDEPNMVTPSVSLDDLADTVADEFLSMLGIEDSSFALDSETEPESPRERLLREFEKEAEASGCSLFGFDIDEEEMEDYDYYAPTISGWEEYSEDSAFLRVDQHEYPKIRAKVMEDLETQELMQEWGLDEMAFQSSPPDSRGGFGSPIDLPPIESLQLPSLGEGLGPFVQTETGGFLRSMNPNHFTNAKSGGSLIMQVSSPVVVPAELGSGVIDILQNLASIGLEKLSVQASKLMPLEDITGRTMQQIAWEAAPHVEVSESQYMLQDERRDGLHVSDGNKQVKQPSSGRKSKKTSASLYSDEAQSEFVSLEDLAPLAVDKIEALSIEGLRIQSGMSDEEAPSNIHAQSIGEVSAVERKGITSIASMGLEGAAGLKLLALEDSGVDSDDGLMSLSLTLDEWMKLDSGEIDEDERLSERTSKLLAAHHAKSTDLNMFGRKGDKKQGKGSGRRCGLLGNNFTVALMVQLRDPLRDYEPVGTPMLALIQVERVFVPPKPKIYSTVSAPKDSSDEDDLESVTKEEKKQEPEEKIPEQDFIPQYKISEVHVSGLKSEPGKKKLWGSSAQQQSGSRWLLANGMGKGKNSFMKPKIAAKSSLPATVASQPGDTLWSISAKFHGSGAKWKQLAALNPHIRNPNVILPNETIKLR